jgi:hypothetical protein
MKTNDEKTLDNDHGTDFIFMGKPRKINKVNMRQRREAAQIKSKLVIMDMLDDKSFDELEKKVKEYAKILITPISKAELEDIDPDEFESVINLIDRRAWKRRGYTDEMLDEMESKGVQEQFKAIVSGNLGDKGFPNPTTE